MAKDEKPVEPPKVVPKPIKIVDDLSRVKNDAPDKMKVVISKKDVGDSQQKDK